MVGPKEPGDEQLVDPYKGLMVANNYLNEGRSHTEVIELMSLGFTGKLLWWWNNCLTEESKEDIKHAVQKDEEGIPIFD